MKLKDGFVTQDVDDTQFLLSLGGEGFGGVVRSNRTAAFIIDHLKENITFEALVDAVCNQFDAPRETISSDVGEVLNTLRSIGALEE